MVWEIERFLTLYRVQDGQGWHHYLHPEDWQRLVCVTNLCWWYHIWINQPKILWGVWIQIKKLKNSIFVSQGKYIKYMLKKFRMDDAKSISTLMRTNGSLDSDTSGNMVDQKMYRSMIESLLYVTASRPDIMLVHACVQNSKPHQEKVIWRQQKEYWGTWRIHKMLVCGIPKVQSLNQLDISIRTMRDTKLREEAHWAHVNCWEDHLSHGHPRNKIVLHYQPSKQNTLRPIVVMHKSYGWRPPWRTLESISKKFHCYVIMKVPWSSPTIQLNIQEQSI